MPPNRSTRSNRDASFLSSNFTSTKSSHSSAMKPSSRATAAARSRDRDRHLADTVDSIAWTAQRLAAEDSTLADERVAWAVKYERLQAQHGALKTDMQRMQALEQQLRKDLRQEEQKVAASEEHLRAADVEFDKLRRQDADTAQKLEELQRDERALRLELGRCQQALGEGAVAADQAAAASQRAMEDLEAKKLAEEERLSGELRTSQYEARLARDARDALRIELESTISEHESHSREAVNRLKEQLRSAQTNARSARAELEAKTLAHDASAADAAIALQMKFENQVTEMKAANHSELEQLKARARQAESATKTAQDALAASRAEVEDYATRLTAAKSEAVDESKRLKEQLREAKEQHRLQLEQQQTESDVAMAELRAEAEKMRVAWRTTEAQGGAASAATAAAEAELAVLRPRAQAATTAEFDLVKLRDALSSEQGAKQKLATQLEQEGNAHARTRSAVEELTAWQQQHLQESERLSAKSKEGKDAMAALERKHEVTATALNESQAREEALQAERASLLEKQRKAEQKQEQLTADLHTKSEALSAAELEVTNAHATIKTHESALKEQTAQIASLEKHLVDMEEDAKAAAASASELAADLRQQLAECKEAETSAQFQLTRLKETTADQASAIKEFEAAAEASTQAASKARMRSIVRKLLEGKPLRKGWERLCLAVAVHGAKVGVENSMANQLSALARDHDAVIDELTDKHDRTLKLHDSQWQRKLDEALRAAESEAAELARDKEGQMEELRSEINHLQLSLLDVQTQWQLQWQHARVTRLGHLCSRFGHKDAHELPTRLLQQKWQHWRQQVRLVSAATEAEAIKQTAIEAVKAEHHLVVEDLKSQYETLEAQGQHTQEMLDSTMAKAAQDLEAAERVRVQEAETAEAAAHAAANELTALQEALKVAKEEGQSSDATSASLQEQLEESQQSHREAEDATAEALREVAQLEGQLQQARTLGEELSETTAALTRRLEEEQAALLEAKDEGRLLRSQLERTLADLARAEDDAENARASTKKVEAQRVQLRSELDLAEASVETSEAKARDALRASRKLESEVKHVALDLTESRTQGNALSKRLEEANAALATTQQSALVERAEHQATHEKLNDTIVALEAAQKTQALSTEASDAAHGVAQQQRLRCAIRLGINAIGTRKRWHQWTAYTVAQRVHAHVTARLSAASAEALQALQDSCDTTVASLRSEHADAQSALETQHQALLQEHRNKAEEELQALTTELDQVRRCYEEESAKVATANQQLVKQAAAARTCVGWAILSQGLHTSAATAQELNGNFDESTNQMRAEHAAEVAATATAHAQALQTAAASADARLKALQEQVTTAEQATVAASTGQAMARAHARDAEAETKAAQARAHEAMETLETCELELDSFRAKNATLMTHLGEIQRRLLTWGLNPKAFLGKSESLLNAAASEAATTTSTPARKSRESSRLLTSSAHKMGTRGGEDGNGSKTHNDGDPYDMSSPPFQGKKGKQGSQVTTPLHFHEGPGSTDGHTGNCRRNHHRQRSPSGTHDVARGSSSSFSATPHKHHSDGGRNPQSLPPPPNTSSPRQQHRSSSSAHAPHSSSKEHTQRRSLLSLEPPPLPSEKATSGILSLTPKTHRSSSAAAPTPRDRQYSSTTTPHRSSQQRSPERYSYSSLGHSKRTQRTRTNTNPNDTEANAAKRAQRNHRNQDTHYY